MSIDFYPSPRSVVQELDIPEEAIESAAVRFVFNHFARNNLHGTKLDRMTRVFEESREHVDMRRAFLSHKQFFFPKEYEIDEDALTLAALCRPYLTESTGLSDLHVNGLPDRISMQTIKRALKIQNVAEHIKAAADIDYPKTRKADNDPYSRESYFLSYITLLEKMHIMNHSNADYEDLSDHLRYDLIFAPEYISRNNGFGRNLLCAIDVQETAIVEKLAAECRVKISRSPAREPALTIAPS